MKTNAKIEDELLCASEVCRKLGIHKSGLSRMVRAGLPVAERRRSPQGGPPRQWFLLEQVRRWIAGHAERASKSQTNALNCRPVEPDRAPPPVPPVGTDTREGWQSALDRARAAEKDSYTAYKTCVADRDLSGAAIAHRSWLAVIDQLRKMECDAARIELQRGEVIPVAEHERIFMTSHTLAVNALREIPKRVAPTLAGMKDVHEIGALLNREIKTAMASIARELSKLNGAT